MKAEQLRLGNLFIEENSKKIIEVIGLEKDRIIFSGMFLENWQAKQIPLTAEWLLNFGFVFDGVLYKANEDLRIKSSKDIGVKYQAYFFNDRLNRWMDAQTRVCIDYVHQLQNLYFSLTGEELTLKAS